MRGDVRPLPYEIHEVKRFLNNGPAFDSHNGNLVQKRRVERDERPVIIRRVLAQVRFNLFLCPQPDSRRERSRDELSIHKSGGQRFGPRGRNISGRRRKSRPRYRGDIGEAPLFIVSGRETQFRETPESVLTQFLHTRRGRLLPCEVRKPGRGLFGYRAHTLPTASSSS
jgi:hypothetical protein